MRVLDVCGEHLVEQRVFGQGVGVLLPGAQLGRGCLLDGGDRNHHAVLQRDAGVAVLVAHDLETADADACGRGLVTPTADLPDTGLEQVLDGCVAAYRIAVDGRVAAGEL